VRTLGNDDVHPHPIKWDKQAIKVELHRLWVMRDNKSHVVPFTVLTYRRVAVLRREFDRTGYSLRAITIYQQGKPGWLALSIRVKYRGNRPQR